MKINSSLVSIIVTTKNSHFFIKKCLESIKKQSYKNIEIIVVDNNSTDNTKTVAKQYTRYVYNKGFERSAQRNYGIKKAKGIYLLYLDSDMTLSKNVIKQAVIILNESSKIVALYIPEIIKGDSCWTKLRNFERGFYNETAIDAVRIARKKDILAIKGFDESMYTGEDWDLNKRIKKRGELSSTKAPLYHDEHDFKISNFISKKAYYAKGIDPYIKKWGMKDPDLKKQFGLYYRFIEVFIENNKWKKILRHPILTIKMLVLRTILTIVYLSIKNKKINKI